MSGRDRTLARNNSLDPLGKDPGSPGPSPRRGPGNPKETLRNATPSSLYVDATSMSLASGQVTNWWSLAVHQTKRPQAAREAPRLATARESPDQPPRQWKELSKRFFIGTGTNSLEIVRIHRSGVLSPTTWPTRD